MMNQSTIDPILRDQALGSAIQYHIRDVVKAAAKTVSVLQPLAARNDSGMLNNQFSNLVNVAMAAKSVEEIAAFILYQMGRSKPDQQWRYGHKRGRDKVLFGDQVVDDLLKGRVKDTAIKAKQRALDSINNSLKKTLADSKSESEIEAQVEAETTDFYDKAHIALARQYIGYLNRLFYFANSIQKSEEKSKKPDMDIQKGWKRIADLIQAENKPVGGQS